MPSIPLHHPIPTGSRAQPDRLQRFIISCICTLPLIILQMPCFLPSNCTFVLNLETVSVKYSYFKKNLGEKHQIE